MGSLTYSYPWKDYVLGTEIDYGRDIFGAHYTRLTGFLRYGDALHSDVDSVEESGDVPRPDRAEIFVDAGVVANRVLSDITSCHTITPSCQTITQIGRASCRERV